MDEKNGRTSSFLDLLERMKSYLVQAKKTSGDIAERQKSLTEQAAEKDAHKEKDTEDEGKS